MTLLKKLIVTLLVVAVLVVVALYIVVQTRWGANQVTGWINENSRYHLTFDRLDHHWASPTHLVLENVSFGQNGHPASLVAKSVDIGLSSHQLVEPRRVSSLTLTDGTLNLNSRPLTVPLQADTLRLKQMALNGSGESWPLSGKQINGGISPWLPEAGYPTGKEARIEISAGEITLNGIPARNVLVQGNIRDRSLTLTTIGADLSRGALTASARRDADGHWLINTLRLNNIRLQSDKPLGEFLKPITHLNSLKINNMDITDARLQGPGWAVTDLDMNLRNVTLSQGVWSSDDGALSLNASEFIYGRVHLFDPIFNADLSPGGVKLRQFTSRWENGMIRATGEWQRASRTLALNELVLAGFEYTLPDNWRSLWQARLPEWLNAVTVKSASAGRNLLIDIDPEFPFQLTGLDGSGSQLQLVRNRQWGLWSGTLNLNAATATFNRTDLRHPSIKLEATPDVIRVSELSAFAGEGLMEGSAIVSQMPQRQFSLTMNGRNVPLDVLSHWGWPLPDQEGNGNLQLDLDGSLAAGTPLKSSVNGRLKVTDARGQQTEQRRINGELAGNASVPQPQQPPLVPQVAMPAP
ncbi:AsmA family protein [Erwinia sp. CPCC 100877]|nr:AsmA family protein [Erwinia sp. CPCC 100877]